FALDLDRIDLALLEPGQHFRLDCSAQPPRLGVASRVKYEDQGPFSCRGGGGLFQRIVERLVEGGVFGENRSRDENRKQSSPDRAAPQLVPRLDVRPHANPSLNESDSQKETTAIEKS